MKIKILLACASILLFFDAWPQSDILKPISLNFDFKDEHPIDFVVRDQRIYVGDGRQVYCFDLAGNFLCKASFNNIGFASFDVRNINGVLKYYLIWNGKLYIFNAQKLEKEINLRCQNFKVNADGIVFFDFQEPLNSNSIDVDTIIDKLGSYDFRTNKTTKYKLKYNAQVQSMDSSGAIYWAYDNMIYFLNPKLNSFIATGPEYPYDGTSKFIGFIKGRSYIKFYGGSHLDSFYVQTNKVNKIELKIVDLKFEELHKSIKKDHDYLMEDHAGVHYFFDGINSIYYMRYTKLFCEIGPLESVLK